MTRHKIYSSLLFLFITSVIICCLALPTHTLWAENERIENSDASASLDKNLSPEKIRLYRKLGIRLLRGKHLWLFTDLPAEREVDQLSRVFDLAVPQWAAAFGIPGNRWRTWKMTGFLMKDPEKFRRAGLFPVKKMQNFRSGFSQNGKLWMFDQPSSYYRRHLLLHEGVHGFMTAFFPTVSPPWHAEGMAELLATHWWGEASESGPEVAYFPRAKTDVPMLGRIRIVRDEVAKGRTLNLKQILSYGADAHSNNVPYGWCWALAAFLDGHPQYQERFRELNRTATGSNINEAFLKTYADDWQALEAEWLLFVREIDYAYAFDRAAIQYRKGEPLSPFSLGSTTTISVSSGWQSSGTLLQAGETYHIRAKGRFTMQGKTANERWPSDPGGITLHYLSGHPLGVLQAVLIPSQKTGVDFFDTSHIQLIGRGKQWTPNQSGTLYLRINNKASQLPNNEGTIDVSIRVNDLELEP
jgi:hypothetical protein